MSDWDRFCSTLDFASVVPDELARYRLAVADGLAFFLENLDPLRAIDLLGDQAALPPNCGVEERLVAIARHCPALHKLGQVLARDRRLPLRFRRLLQRLESLLPADDLAWIHARLEDELGPLAEIGVHLDEEPLAEASAAVVVPFTWEAGGEERRRGVFKILKPGIEEKLEEELWLLQRVGALLDGRCRQYGLPRIAYEGTFTQVRDLLQNEVRLDREQAHLAAAAKAYAGMAAVQIPEVYPFCSPRLTAMQRIDGQKVTDVAGMPADARRALAETIVEALLAHPIWSPGPETMFHADPHAGNLFATNDGRLAILDWSLVGSLGKHHQIGLTRILVGAATRDGGRIADALAALAGMPADGGRVAAVVATSLSRLGREPWPSLAWLTALMDAAAAEAGLRFGADLTIFRKVLHTLAGVVADVSERCDPDAVLASAFVRTLALEAGVRLVSAPYSRALASHLSNLDLAEVVLSAPLAAWRYWSDAGRSPGRPADGPGLTPPSPASV